MQSLKYWVSLVVLLFLIPSTREPFRCYDEKCNEYFLGHRAAGSLLNINNSVAR